MYKSVCGECYHHKCQGYFVLQNLHQIRLHPLRLLHLALREMLEDDVDGDELHESGDDHDGDRRGVLLRRDQDDPWQK